MDERLSWDKYFMMIARDVSTRSTCLRRQVGAVVVKEKMILATGYNGAPTNITHCTNDSCLRTKYNVPSGERHELCRGLHAEQNAIIQAAYHGVAISKSIIYVTHQPCSICTKMLINSGISKFTYKSPYNDQLAGEMVREADIEIKIMKDDEKAE